MSVTVEKSLKRFGRYTTLLYLFFVALFLGVFLFVVLRIENNALLQQEKSFNDQQFLQTQIAAHAFQESLDSLLVQSAQSSSGTARELLLGNLGQEQAREDYRQKLGINSALLGYCLFNADQQLVLEVAKKDLTTMKSMIQHWRNRHWAALGVGEIKQVVPAFHVTQDDQIMGVLTPVEKDGKFLGMQISLVDIGVLSRRYVAVMRSGQYGAGYMLDERGTILYDHETEVIGRSVFDGMHDAFPQVQRIDQLLISQPSGQDEYRFTVDRDNKEEVRRKLISWNTATIEDRKFIIALSAPDTEIVGSLAQFRNQDIALAIFLSALLVATTFLYFRQRNRLLYRTTQHLEEEVERRTASQMRAEKSYRDIFENAGIGIYRTTPDGRLLRANPYLVRLQGCDSEQDLILAANFNEDRWYVSPTRRQEFKSLIEQQGFVEGFVSEIKGLKNRQCLWISETAYAVYGDNGEILYYEGTLQDVTHMKEAEEALRHSEARLRAHIAAMPDLGMIFDINGKIIEIYGNEIYLETPRDEMIGKSIHKAPPIYNPEQWIEAIEATVASGERQTFEYYLPIKETPHWFEARTALLREDGVLSPQVIVLIRDITRRYIDQQALLETLDKADQANQSKSEFLAHMSHELRTPLNAILGYSEMMSREMLGPITNAKYTEYVNDIHTSGKHILDIINDVLDLSKIEAGRFTPDREVVSLPELIESTNRIISGTVQEKNLTYQCRDIPDIDVRVDKRAIRQILLNLLSNAIKFTPEGGKVSLSTTADAERGVIFTIKDTGVGIAHEDIPKVLEPFVRLESDTTRDAAGTGIGLSLSKKLVELHGGTIEIDSVPGQGTEVTVTLPPSCLVQEQGNL